MIFNMLHKEVMDSLEGGEAEVGGAAARYLRGECGLEEYIAQLEKYAPLKVIYFRMPQPPKVVGVVTPPNTYVRGGYHDAVKFGHVLIEPSLNMRYDEARMFMENPPEKIEVIFEDDNGNEVRRWFKPLLVGFKERSMAVYTPVAFVDVDLEKLAQDAYKENALYNLSFLQQQKLAPYALNVVSEEIISIY